LGIIISVAASKIFVNIAWKVLRKISALIESFRNFATILKIMEKIVISQNVDKNEYIEEHSICNFSTNFSGGQGNSSNSSGWRRNIAESFANTLDKML